MKLIPVKILNSKTLRLLMICLLSGITIKAQTLKNKISELSRVETGFISAPDEIQTSIYWYWISDNISKEGVIKDLEAMKKVGINRAFIGNIAIPEVPYGKVKFLSDEWWEIMHTTLKTATRLGIEIGIFNGPGWSQSGGPWVKPQQSMRYLSSSQIVVNGPVAFNAKLLKPDPDFQDVKVIAYPVSDYFDKDLTNFSPALTSNPKIDNLESLVDKNEATGIRLKHDQQYTIDLTVKDPFTARSLTIIPLADVMSVEGYIQVKDKEEFKTIKHFSVDRSNNELIVGFKPYGPATIALPATSSRQFRIVFSKAGQNGGIAELKISSMPVVESYIEKTLAKMWQTPFPYWNAYQWPTQPKIEDQSLVIDPARVVDISKQMNPDGTLNWKVPEGKWVIERTGMVPTGVHNGPASPEGKGLETDKMSKEHITAHFNAFMGQILKRIPAQDRKCWKVTVEDSYETGGQNWTDGFIEKFQSNYGYDPTPYIPVLQGKVVGSAESSDRFLWDLRRFVADKVAYDYVGGLRDISHKHGLTTWLENYGHWGFPGEFLQYGGQSDDVGGEFWSVGNLGDIENRAASSCAHIYGKVKVSAESFTSVDPPFSRDPANMKQRADRFFTEGINSSLLHVYVHQPYEDKVPGLNANFGNEFNRNNTWFYDMDIFLKYLKRCNMLLQQGTYVADVAYFISEDTPKMTGITDPALPFGYSFDYINAEVIKTRLSVKNGRLFLPDGLSYGVLVLPKLKTMRPELLLKIKELVSQGAVILGPKPERSPSLQNGKQADLQVQIIADQLWGKIDGKTVKTNHFGKGVVIDGMDLQEALNMLKIKPDFKTTSLDAPLFIHRTLSDGEVYFLSNQKDHPIKFTAQFRLKGMIPELWDPISGSTRKLPQYSESEDHVAVPLQLDATGSAFIIFRKASKTSGTNLSPRDNYPNPDRNISITAPWQVNFENKSIGPLKPVTFEKLTGWSQNQNDSIKYYSGSAFYYNTFNLEVSGKDTHVILDLGMVNSIAKVKVNGIAVGGVWTAPYRLDITKALKKGINELEIKVTNTWVNRLIGDSKLPVEKRKTSLTNNPYNPQSNLSVSGLLGPVKLEMITY